MSFPVDSRIPVVAPPLDEASLHPASENTPSPPKPPVKENSPPREDGAGFSYTAHRAVATYDARQAVSGTSERSRRQCLHNQCHSTFWEDKVDTPKLLAMIGDEEVEKLDLGQGRYREARTKGKPGGLNPWERDKDGNRIIDPDRVIFPHDDGSPCDLKELLKPHMEAMKQDPTKKCLAVVGVLGRITVTLPKAVGVTKAAAGTSESDRIQYLGHPNITGKGKARKGLEFFYNPETDRFVINNKSGRFSKHDDAPVTEEQLKKTQAEFKRNNLDVDYDYYPPKKNAPEVNTEAPSPSNMNIEETTIPNVDVEAGPRPNVEAEASPTGRRKSIKSLLGCPWF